MLKLFVIYCIVINPFLGELAYSQTLDDPRWPKVEAGVVREIIKSQTFVHTSANSTSDLNSPFIAVYDESDRTLGWATSDINEIMSGYQQSLINIPAVGLHQNLRVIFARGASGNFLDDMKLNAPIQSGSPTVLSGTPKFTGMLTLRERIKNSYFDLYQQYTNQGAGRTDQLYKFKDQDLRNSKRITHIIVTVGNEEVAHVQAMHSFSPAELLNLEESYGLIPARAHSNPCALRPCIEIGRLNVRRLSELSPRTQHTLKPQGGREYIRDLLYLHLFQWLAEDVKPALVTMQVNGIGKDHLLKAESRNEPQWEFDSSGFNLETTADHEEWRLDMNPKNLAITADRMMKNIIQKELDLAQRSNHRIIGPGIDQSRPLQKLTYLARANQLPSLNRLKILNALPSRVTEIDPRPLTCNGIMKQANLNDEKILTFDLEKH